MIHINDTNSYRPGSTRKCFQIDALSSNSDWSLHSDWMLLLSTQRKFGQEILLQY